MGFFALLVHSDFLALAVQLCHLLVKLIDDLVVLHDLHINLVAALLHLVDFAAELIEVIAAAGAVIHFFKKLFFLI